MSTEVSADEETPTVPSKRVTHEKQRDNEAHSSATAVTRNASRRRGIVLVLHIVMCEVDSPYSEGGNRKATKGEDCEGFESLRSGAFRIDCAHPVEFVLLMTGVCKE